MYVIKCRSFRERGRPKRYDEGGLIWDSLGSVVKTAEANAIPPMTAAEKMKRGRPKKAASNGGNFFDTIESIGRSVAPFAADIGREVVLPVAKNVGRCFKFLSNRK